MNQISNKKTYKGILISLVKHLNVNSKIYANNKFLLTYIESFLSDLFKIMQEHVRLNPKTLLFPEWLLKRINQNMHDYTEIHKDIRAHITFKPTLLIETEKMQKQLTELKHLREGLSFIKNKLYDIEAENHILQQRLIEKQQSMTTLESCHRKLEEKLKISRDQLRVKAAEKLTLIKYNRDLKIETQSLLSCATSLITSRVSLTRKETIKQFVETRAVIEKQFKQEEMFTNKQFTSSFKKFLLDAVAFHDSGYNKWDVGFSDMDDSQDMLIVDGVVHKNIGYQDSEGTVNTQELLDDY